jgi:hypothetical protein
VYGIARNRFRRNLEEASQCGHKKARRGQGCGEKPEVKQKLGRGAQEG